MRHLCAANDCHRLVPESMLMCAPHWRRVPKDVQRRVYRTWNRGHPTTDYPAAVRAARASLDGGE